MPSHKLSLCIAAIGVSSVVGCLPIPADYVATRSYQPKPTSIVSVSATEASKTKLNAAKRLAFQLPSECAEPTAPSSDREKRTKLLDLHCGALAGELEAEGIRAGYAVVSWREISDAADPLEAARNAKADLVLKVNERETKATPSQLLNPHSTLYSGGKATAVGEEHPFAPLSGDASARCDAQFDTLANKPVSAVTIEVEAIDPNNRSAVWRLDRLVASPEHASGHWVAEHAEAVKVPRFSPIVSLSAFFVMGLAGVIAPPIADSGKDLEGLQYAGAGVMIGTVAAMLIIPSHIDLWPSPHDTMCKSGESHWTRTDDSESERIAKAANVGRSVATEVVGRLTRARDASEKEAP